DGFSSLLSGQCSSIGGQLCDYHFIGENMTWKEAKDYCKKNHTDLATVSNQTDMKRLLNSTTEQYQGGAWIGLQDKTTNTVCRWRWSQSGVEFNVTESNQKNSAVCRFLHAQLIFFQMFPTRCCNSGDVVYSLGSSPPPD
uniref:C-type lectin domain-containing protein n=1 Tax=Sander lucioperca TaxID=283035 RepID=A0A8C9XF93_SANLU